MKIIYSEALRQSSDLFALAQRASQLLEDVATRSSPLATAAWDFDRDERGQAVVLLRLSDWIASVTARFSPAELANVDALSGRLNRLWGDLLQVRSHRLLDELDKSFSDSGAS
jgi:hypothetical protein